MKNFVFPIFCSVVFFIIGYIASSKVLLESEFSEVTSSAVSGTFLERSSLYILASHGEQKKLENLLAILIVGDIASMKMSNFSATRNSEKLCLQLKQLKRSTASDAIFYNELIDVLEKCS